MIGKQVQEEIEKSKMGLVEDYVPDDENTWEPRGPSDPNEPHKELPSSAQELEDMYTEARVHGEFAGEKQSGDGGFDWEEIVALNSEEVISWEDALREYLTIKSKTKKNWMKPSNKWLQHGFWMPSKGGKSLDDIVIMIDESGSMSEEEIQAVFTNISELFEGGDIPLCKVAVIHFSGYDDIPDEHIEIVHEGDMPEYSRRTSGGTDFEGAFKKAVQLEERGMIQPSCYIILQLELMIVTNMKSKIYILWIKSININLPLISNRTITSFEITGVCYHMFSLYHYLCEFSVLRYPRPFRYLFKRLR